MISLKNNAGVVKGAQGEDSDTDPKFHITLAVRGETGTEQKH